MNNDPLPRVALIGDSISVQYEPFLAKALEGFAHLNRRATKSALENLDIPGGANTGDSRMLLTYTRHAVENAALRGDDLLLFNCGLHDIKTSVETGEIQVGSDDYRQNLQEAVRLLSGEIKNLAWVRTTPCHEHIHNKPGKPFHRSAEDCEAYNAIADEVMSANGVPIIDLNRFTANQGGDEIYCDHVHFTEEIRARQAAFLGGWITAFLAERQKR